MSETVNHLLVQSIRKFFYKP